MSALKAVVVGAGLIGLSAARALTLRGVGDVRVVDSGVLAGGGTGKSSGVVRSHYGVPSLAAMAWRSLPYFEEAPDETGFRQAGYLVGVGEENAQALRANVSMQQKLGIDTDLLSADAAARLWPHARLDDLGAFAFEPRGGYGDASQTALAYSREARARGAEIVQRTPVAGLVTDGDTVRGVRLADGDVMPADVVVVAAGPWSPALLAPLGIDVPVRAERVELVMVDSGAPLPDVPVLSDLVSLQYIRPERSGHLLLGNSDHSAPEYADPATYSNKVGEAGLERAVTKFAHRFPGLSEAAVTGSYAGCYDVTPDYNPVIGATPARGLFLAAGFSGHGFKISPAVGALTADLVLDGGSRDPDIRAEDFRLSRFSEGDLLVSRHPYIGSGEMR